MTNVYNRITYIYSDTHKKEIYFNYNISDGNKNKSIHNKPFERNYESESISRAKKNLYHIAHANEWQYFGTLTIDQKKADRYNYDNYKRLLTQFFNNWRKHYAPYLKYIYVIEQHKDGAYHSHYLVSNIGNTKFGKISDSDKTYDTVKNYKLGRNTIEKVVDTKRVASYIISYISKDINIPKGKQRYCCSQNLDKPKILKDNVPFNYDEYKKDINVSYIKEVNNDFCKMIIVDYNAL